MKKTNILQNNIYQRFILYFLIWNVYLTFMSIYSPLGINWLDWHSQRIFNFSEFLKLNGFFSHYGFSVWSKCINCVLNSDIFEGEIYLSLNLISNLPYVILNNYFGEDFLKLNGHYIDKSIILITGILIAEIFNKKNANRSSSNENFYFSIIIFTFFVINPWTYKMLLAHWMHIFFVFFFILGIYMFILKNDKLGFFFFLIAGFTDYQSAAGLMAYFMLILILSYLKNDLSISDKYFPTNSKKQIVKNKIILSFFFPLIIFIFLKILATNNIEYSSGSSILSRIGISGNDLNNGGIIGSLQFLGGNRITQCLTNFDYNFSNQSLDEKIYIFNCSLSIISLGLISLASIFSLFVFDIKKSELFTIIILPFLFLLLSYSFILQQSSSVHLMGYSYFFSIIFSYGLASLFLNVLKKYNFSVSSIILSLPIIIGIFFICIRVNMLTGLNG